MAGVVSSDPIGVVCIGGAPSVVLSKYGNNRVYGNCVFERAVLLKWIEDILHGETTLDARETATVHLLRAAIAEGSPYFSTHYYANRDGKKGPSQLWAGWARMKHPSVPLNKIKAIDVGSGEIKVITPSGNTTFDATEFYTLDASDHQAFFDDLIAEPHFIIGTAKARAAGFSFAIAVEDEAYAEFEAANETYPSEGPIDLYVAGQDAPVVLEHHYLKGKLSFGGKSLQGVMIEGTERAVYTTNIGTHDIVESIKTNHSLGAITIEGTRTQSKNNGAL